MQRNTTTIAALLATFLTACSSPAPVAKEQAPAPEPVKITQFYASNPNPAPGETSMLCYGTENATAVALEPPVDDVWPSPSHCLKLEPKITTRYTLTASRGAEKVTQSLSITMGKPRPELIKVNVDSLEVAPGTRLTICYQARYAASVTVTPGEWFGGHTPDAGCIQHDMQRSTLFKVRVLDDDGTIIDGEDVEVRVK